MEGKLNVESANSRTVQGARHEALAAVEQKMVDKAKRQERTHGKLQNIQQPAEGRIKEFANRHEVSTSEPRTLKLEGEEYSRKNMANLEKRITAESREGSLKTRTLRGIGTVGIALDMASTVVDAAKMEADQRYIRGEYVLHDSDGDFTIGMSRKGLFHAPEYFKTYSNDKREIITHDDYEILKEEAHDAYGKEKIFNWEPGLLIPELIEESENDRVDII